MISTEPATGKELWRGAPGNVEQAMEIAVAAKTDWARQPVGQRVELMRRFANEVRKQLDALAKWQQQLAR